ncbi:MAG: phosphate ABC transporter substrate-binding protein PstS [Kaiparowitsia implicata GSE-PSE-MK54-09C]|nr:phosphate ABC transporter substrate-binding protein PstS [Kaiparowitsia implicata GSE-PSE-MK54-09C]
MLNRILLRNASRRQFLGGAIALSLGIKACQPQTSTPSSLEASADAPEPPVTLYGAGATLPSFLYLRWFQEYNTRHPQVQISYQPIGSAAGIQQFLVGTVDFGATEVPLTDAEVAQVEPGALFIPSAAGSIAVVYNLPGVTVELRLSREVLPEIFLGVITQWNDPKLVALNPDLDLPDQPITVIHRSDGSGTTAAFTAYLSAISPTWQSAVGQGLSVAWPAGIGIKDNAGISAQIIQAEGVIGYVEYAFAKQLNLATAVLENQAGQFVAITDEATARAIATIELSDDLRGAVADPDDPEAYPIVTYSWLLVYQHYDDPQKAAVLRDLIQWGLQDGQAFGPELGYVPLPAEVVQRATRVALQIS